MAQVDFNTKIPEKVARILEARAKRLGMKANNLLEDHAKSLAKQELIDEDPIASIEPAIEAIEARANAAAAARGEV